MNKNKKKEGSAILIVVGFMIIASILAAAMLTAASTVQRISQRQVNGERALFMAEAGVEFAADYISQLGGYIGDSAEGSGSTGDGDWNYSISQTAFREYEMSATGTVNNVSRSIHIDRVYLPTYATFAMWQHENGQIYFVPGEEFFGHVHSNDKFWFTHWGGEGPVFWDELTSAHDTYGGDLTYAVFHKGFDLNTEVGSMATVDFPELQGFAQNYGLTLLGKTEMTFAGDQVLITNSRKNWDEYPYTIGDEEIIYVETASSGDDRDGKVELLGGELDGRLTVVSDNDMYISDHITYNENPADFPDSDDALGLISKDDIWIRTCAPDDIIISATMMAVGARSASNRGSFGVLDYWDWDVGPRGAIHLYGGVVQDKRGAVGQFGGGGQGSGYCKNYTFDDRFENMPPPFYPPIDDTIRFAGWSDSPKG